MEYDGVRLIGNAIRDITDLGIKMLNNPDLYGYYEGSASPENKTGDPNYNINLAERRATTVINIFNNLFVPEGQMNVTSTGDTRARAANAPVSDYPKYRGVFHKLGFFKRKTEYD